MVHHAEFRANGRVQIGETRAAVLRRTVTAGTPPDVGLELVAARLIGVHEPLALGVGRDDAEDDEQLRPAEFAGDQGRVLDWFYQRSLYWDDRKDVYPVGKIFDRNVLSRLKTS